LFEINYDGEHGAGCCNKHFRKVVPGGFKGGVSGCDAVQEAELTFWGHAIFAD
jgi:hypothetical protein